MLFFDNFSAPLNPNNWDYNHFSPVNNPSFYGRTQQRQSLPSVSGGLLHLELDTFNPTGFSFYGSEAITKQTFAPSDGEGIAFEVSARIVTPVPGFVGGFFGYNFNSSTGLDNELDTELLSNDAAAGRNQAETNVYGNEPLGAGHPQFVGVLDLTQFHTYRMEWFPNRVRWFIDNYLVREDTVHIPQGAMALHLNIWAPDTTFADAYSASLQPTSNPAANMAYFVDVAYARVTQLGIYTPVFCCKDLNGDGRADILWRDISGDVYSWLMNGLNVIGSGSLGTIGNVWQIAVIGDFNGDGNADILWFNNASGDVYIWLLNGLSVIGQGSVNVVPTGWQVAGVGDLNGDGKADTVWRNTLSGEVSVSLMNGLNVIASGSLGIVGNDWHIVGVGDLNGDGKADILWRNTSGEVYVWLMNGLNVIGQGSLGVITNDWQVIGIGDFNGDGKADVLWRNNVSGQVYVWLMNGLSILAQGSVDVVGNNWQIVGVGDLNGDGKADILWRDNNTADVYEWLMNGLTVIGQGSVAIIGDGWYIN